MESDSLFRSRLTRAHLAFAKGWIMGLDLADLANRYLAPLGGGTTVDLRVAKTVLRNVLQDLQLAAKRNHISGANALTRRAQLIKGQPTGETSRPSFEAYRASLVQAEEFSETELLDAYNDRYPPDPSTKAAEKANARQSRLIKRQLDLLRELESKVSQPIQWTDHVENWFSPSISSRLKIIQIETIQELAQAIVWDPRGWFKEATGIGRGKALRIDAFLRAHLGTLEQYVKPRSTALTLQNNGNASHFQPSPLLVQLVTATAATNKALIRASNDHEALQIWLSLKKSAATVTLYRREVTRLIDWSLQTRNKPLPDLQVEDAIAFRDFLGNVPSELLVKKGPREPSSKSRFGTMQVGGFTKRSLDPASIKKTLTVINAFFEWLMKVHYVEANPFAGVKNAAVPLDFHSTEAKETRTLEHGRLRRKTVLERTLPKEVTQAIENYLDQTPETKDFPFFARMRFIYKLAGLGLRISEIAAARRDHLEYVQADPVQQSGAGWILHVLGKRDKPREVPVPDEVIDLLQIYLIHRGLLQAPHPTLPVEPGIFLVGAYPTETGRTSGQRVYTKQPGDGVRPQTIHLAFKELCARVLHQAELDDPKSGRKLGEASMHWLRHTSASRAVEGETPLDIVAAIWGHASISTTSIYLRSERKRKIAEMQKFWRKQ